MGQHVRVVGWLRFNSKAQLTKGLQGFADDAPVEFYDESAWDIDGLDAHVSIDAELPGDFTNVERPFMAMIGAAGFGYVDYFEQGNENISQIHGPGGPLKRWEIASLRNSRVRWLTPSGSRALGYASGSKTVTLSGECEFADAKAATAATAAMFRLPLIGRDGVSELRIGHGVFQRDGARVSVNAAIDGPWPELREPLIEVLASIMNKARSGELVLLDLMARLALGPKGVVTRKSTQQPVVPAPGAISLTMVSAKEPRVALTAAPVADTKKASSKKKKAADSAPLDETGGPVKGAQVVPAGLITWGDIKLTVWSLPDLTPLRTVSTARPGQYPAMIRTLHELPDGRVAVSHESDESVELFDPASGALRHLEHEDDSMVASVIACDERLLGQAICGEVTIWSLDGERLATLPTDDDISSNRPSAVLGDGTVMLPSGKASRRVRVATGEVVEQLGKLTGVHPLSKGRYLLENYGEFELRGGDAPLSFVVDKGNTHQVFQIGDDEVLFRGFRLIHLVSLVDGSHREFFSGHTKDLDALLPLGGGLWATFARSMPGLNERFGFDGSLRISSQDGWTLVGSHDARAPIRQAVPLAGDRLALFFDDVARGKEVDIIDARTAKLVQTIKVPKKGIAGSVALPDGRLIAWCKDRTAYVLGQA